MITQWFAVYDKAVEAYMQPFPVRAKGEAIRSFSLAADKGSFQGALNEYTLYHLGSYDDASGIFTNCPGGPQRVISANEFGVKAPEVSGD